MSTLVARADWFAALAQFQAKTETDLLVVMTMHQTPTFTRELGLFTSPAAK